MAGTLFGWLRPAIVPLVGALGLAAVANHQLSEQRQQLLADREGALRSLVEASLSVVGDWHRRFQSGEISEVEAQQSALRSLRSVRYGDGNYMLVVDEDVIMVMHAANTELAGHDMSDVRDSNGVRIVVAMVEAAGTGGGFVPYRWARADVGQAQKIAYAAPFEPWGWAVVTSVFVDDIDWIIRTQAREIGLMGVLVTIIALFVSYLLPSRKVTMAADRGPSPVRRTIAHARAAAGRDPQLPTEISNLATASDELSRQSERLAAQVAVLKDRIRAA